MNIITNKIELEEHLGSMQPKDPWGFAKEVEGAQSRFDIYPVVRNRGLMRVNALTDKPFEGKVSLLFNKGRYFEMTVHDKALLVSISKATKIKISYENMLVGSWRKLESLVRAFNKKGIEVRINIDWI